MNCILSNDNAFVYDAMMGGIIGPTAHDSNTFATPYGLVYPLLRGWEFLRMLQDVDQPEDLTKDAYLRRYLPSGEHQVIYLDWNGRLWLTRLARRQVDKNVSLENVFVVNRIPQTSHTVFVSRELQAAEQAALNLAMRECSSYKEAFALLEKSTTERFSEPVFVSLEQHKASKPQGAINMPNPIVSSEEVSTSEGKKV